LTSTATEGSSRTEASLRARRQLRRVLSVLALLDTLVLVSVVVLAEARASAGLTTPEFLSLILGAVGAIIAVRVALAVRLKKRSGSLS